MKELGLTFCEVIKADGKLEVDEKTHMTSKDRNELQGCPKTQNPENLPKT